MLLTILAITLGVVCYIYLQKRSRRNLPPGPTPLPLLGNFRDLPPNGPPHYKHWLRFKDEYGPVSCVTILGQLVFVMHDRQMTMDLLKNQSLKTSGRPKLRFAEICGFGSILNLKQYDAGFRSERKLLHQQFGTKASAARFRDTMDLESHRFLVRVLDDPSRLVKHIKTLTGAIILQITYGYSVSSKESDPLVDLVEHAMDIFGRVVKLLSWTVDMFPVLEYLPEGLPGTAFKKTAREYKRILQKTTEVPYAFVRQQMAQGTHQKSYVSSLLEPMIRDGETDKKTEHAIKMTALVMYGGGSDTTASSIHSFIGAMMLFPHVQKRAQEEIDTIVGKDKLPQFSDRNRLPYINALVKETLRWFPVTPLGAAHKTDENIEYQGFNIPKGTYLMPAVWWFLNDPETYSDPTSFNPDRFLPPFNEPNPAEVAFGFGRRVCPGRYLADDSLFITLVRLLAAFDIKKALDESGNEIDPEVHATSGLIARPLDFPYSIKPRSSKAVELIREVEMTHPYNEADVELVRGALASW